MPYYDPSDGQYDDKTKAKLNKQDKDNLIMSHIFGLGHNELFFHHPTFGISDDEYSELFVKYSRRHINNSVIIDDRKMEYLLTPKDRDDKSSFLIGLGYSLRNPEALWREIYQNTDKNTLSFARLTPHALLCKAKTVLRGKIVTTIWALEPIMSLRFITLIPGGDKTWEK